MVPVVTLEVLFFVGLLLLLVATSANGLVVVLALAVGGLAVRWSRW